MKYIVEDHQKPADADILEALRNDEWEHSRDDLMCKAVMWHLSFEKGMNVKEVFDHLIENTDENELFTKSDVSRSLEWWGLLPRSGAPLQARASSIVDVLSFGWEYEGPN